MCGRYTLTVTPAQLAAEFGLAAIIPYDVRYNIAPSQMVPVIRQDASGYTTEMVVVRQTEPGGTRTLDLLRWGLIPHWAKDEKIAYSTINARAETIATQPAFRDAFKKRRCLIPANGFYEWEKAIGPGGKEIKIPHYIRRKDGRTIAMAGLWERWSGPDGKVIESFTIVTTDANDLLRPLHNRMPVILRPDDYDTWLDPATKPEDLQALLVSCPVEWLTEATVNRIVNSPRNDDPSCIEPA